MVGESEGRKPYFYTTMRDVEPPKSGDGVFGIDVPNTKSEVKKTKVFFYSKALLERTYVRTSTNGRGDIKRAYSFCHRSSNRSQFKMLIRT